MIITTAWVLMAAALFGPMCSLQVRVRFNLTLEDFPALYLFIVPWQYLKISFDVYIYIDMHCLAGLSLFSIVILKALRKHLFEVMAWFQSLTSSLLGMLDPSS